MRLFSSLKAGFSRFIGRIRALFYVVQSDVEKFDVAPEVSACDTSVAGIHREAMLSLRHPGVYFPKLYQIVMNLRAIIASVVYGGKYIAFVTALAFACWLSGSQILGIVVMVLIASVVMFATRDFLPAVLPALLVGFVIPSATTGSAFLTKYVAAVVVVCLVFLGALIYVLTARRLKLGSHFFPYLAMAVSMALAGLGYPDYNPTTVFQLAVMTYALAFYFVARNGIKSLNKLYLVKIFCALCVLITVEIIWFYANCDDLAYAIERKTLDLGWGISNCASAAIMITIPMALYGFISTKKMRYLASVLTGYVGVILSLSRGCMLIAVLFLPVMFGMVFVYSDRKKKLALWGIIGVCALTLVLLLVEEFFEGTLEFLADRGFSDSGRLGIYATAIWDFLSNPLFGVGVHNPKNPYSNVYWYHSTPLQFLACAGVVGALAYGYHLLALGKKFIKGLSKPFNLCVVLAVLHWGLYGYMDVNFFFPCQAFAFALLIIAHEMNSEEKSVEEQKNEAELNKKGAQGTNKQILC